MKLFKLLTILFLIILDGCEVAKYDHAFKLNEYGELKKIENHIILEVPFSTHDSIKQLPIEVLLLDSVLEIASHKEFKRITTIIKSKTDTFSKFYYTYEDFRSKRPISLTHQTLFNFIVDSINGNYFSVLSEINGALDATFLEVKDSKYRVSAVFLVLRNIIDGTISRKSKYNQVLIDVFILIKIGYLNCLYIDGRKGGCEALRKSKKLISLMLYLCLEIDSSKIKIKDHTYSDSLTYTSFKHIK